MEPRRAGTGKVEAADLAGPRPRGGRPTPAGRGETPIRRLSGSAVVGGHPVDLTGRAEAPAAGTVIWWRQYRHDPKQDGWWLPTGRPRKAVFVRFVERGVCDDKWEVSAWGCYRRKLSGITLIGSKSLWRIEGTRVELPPVLKAGRKR